MTGLVGFAVHVNVPGHMLTDHAAVQAFLVQSWVDAARTAGMAPEKAGPLSVDIAYDHRGPHWVDDDGREVLPGTPGAVRFVPPVMARVVGDAVPALGTHQAPSPVDVVNDTLYQLGVGGDEMCARTALAVTERLAAAGWRMVREQ